MSLQIRLVNMPFADVRTPSIALTHFFSDIDRSMKMTRDQSPRRFGTDLRF